MSKIMLFAVVIALACCVNALPNPQFGYDLFAAHPYAALGNIKTLFKPLEPGYIEKLGPGANGMSSSMRSWVDSNGKMHREGQVTRNEGGKVDSFKF